MHASTDPAPNTAWCFWAPILAEIERIGAQIEKTDKQSA
jgi:hypothetical protein